MRQREPVHGLLLLDKARGWSSNQALKKAQFLLGAAKAGHGGTLDPLATGLLPLVLGEATRLAQQHLDADKTYLADLRLGVTTDTGDAEGKVTAIAEVNVDPARWSDITAAFVGESQQIPPMYSALKRDGQPLYKLARQGQVVERAARRIVIHSLETVSLAAEHAQIRVCCSKGTYIRTLAEDIGAALGCGAHLVGLRRERIGALSVRDAVTIEELVELDPASRRARLVPLDTLLAKLPPVVLAEDESRRFLLGQRIRLRSAEPAPGELRVYDRWAVADRLIGLARLDDGLLRPVRVIKTNHPTPESI